MSAATPAGAASAGGAGPGARLGPWTRVRRRLARPPGPWSKPVAFALLAAPAAYLVYALFAGELGPDPIEALTDETGELALRFLVLSLALTPLRLLLKATWPIRLRRMIGLFAFFYAALHVAIWVVLDQELDPAAMLADIVERPYVLAGTAAFLVMLPLAATSTKGIARRMGRRWQGLHRWVYLAAAAAVVHFVWLAKGDVAEPYVYLAILAGLYAVRFVDLLRTG